MGRTWLTIPNILTAADEIAPTAFLILVFGVTLLARLPFIGAISQYLGAPFYQFLTADELSEFDAKHSKLSPPTWKNLCLIALAAAHVSGWGFAATFLIVTGQRAWPALIEVVVWVLLALQITIRPPTTPPYSILAFASLHAASAILHCWTSSFLDPASTLRLVGSALMLGIGVSYSMARVAPGIHVAECGNPPSDKFTSPEDSVTLQSWLSFKYMQPLFDLAGFKTLNAEDVWQLSPYFKHKNLFTKYLSTKPETNGQSLLRFLLKSNGLDLLISFSIQMYKAIAGFVPPYCLQQILASLESHDPSRRTDAYLYALVVLVFHCSFAQVDLFDGWHSRRAYERTRGQMFCALHWKSLKRRDMTGRTSSDIPAVPLPNEPAETEQTADIGRVVNLMTGDAYAVAQRFWEFPAVFIAPVRLIIALVFLYTILGWTCLVGVGVVLLAYAINYPLAMLNVSLTRKSWAAKDLRASYVNEFFQSIRFLKYMGWESLWINKVKISREKELRIRVKQNVVDVIISFIWVWIPSAVILVSFLSFTLLAGERLTVSKAFTAIEVFSQLQSPMTQLPGQITALLHAFVSMRRIETFLAEEEVEDWASSLKHITTSSPSGSEQNGGQVGFESATFQWNATDIPSARVTPNEGQRRFSLEDLSVIFPVGKLSLITGATGSGKSSILNALLGEMVCVSGHVNLDKSGHNVAYAAQTPWLEHATIQDNILFRTPFDAARYDAVLECCALKHDLGIFEAGDMTEIGEKGVSLSGGQRARVALARAVYSRAKVVLLDDPLAAVDMHTANHLVKKCLGGPLMKGRTILLVTHHVTLCLPAASYIMELSNGAVFRQGSIKELESKGLLEEVLASEDLPSEPADVSDVTQPNEADQLDPQAEQPTKKTKGKFIEDEHRAEGSVSLLTYVTYMKAAGWVPWTLTLVVILLLRAITVGNQFFLAYWAQSYTNTNSSSTPSLMSQFVMDVSAQVDLSSPFSKLPPPDVNVIPWLIIFTLISLAGGVATIAYLAIGYWASLNASRVLFIAMLSRVSRAPTSFFDRTPIGRILNRFTADIGAVDDALLMSVRAAIVGTISFVASFGVIVLVVPRFSPFALAIAAIYIKLAPPYVKASRDLRRLESIFLSPAFSGFNELLHGLVHVRAFGREMSFQERFYRIVDKFQGFDHFYWMASYWMKERYDYLGSAIVYLTTLFALWTHVPEGMAALVIVNAGVFAEASRQLVKVFAQLELDFNSIERIGEYMAVEQEAAAVSINPPPAYWPSSSGGLVIEDLVVQYGPNLPRVLKGVSFTVNPREKVGVVGRTGSGKSTLAMSLLRIIEPSEGRIILDGIDIRTIGLDDLRGNITIVSQDVALFAGTVRSNLDPFDQHSDEDCWNVLERCHLTSHSPHRTPVESEDSSKTRRSVVTSLYQAVSPSGSSFSAGERQLMALARAMLRNARFTILDEASSSIDLETDDKIQRTIREEMEDSLVITIAHRLKTVIDYDRILVLDMGRIAEYDTPRALLARSDGLFREMCVQSADWEEIQELAQREP